MLRRKSQPFIWWSYFLLGQRQVDEVTDISHPLRDRYQERNPGPGRTLKLSMTDGVQRVTGFEYRPIKGLQVFSPAGIKVMIQISGLERRNSVQFALVLLLTFSTEVFDNVLFE
jgi:hypothetical protein